ncbi:hypothetical protein [Methyloglobulus sp.]|uniref:hypothetical protein n=1 Tax=Methyloglobulus sp. TaxID=2518622 RepID=UPI0032B7E02C
MQNMLPNLDNSADCTSYGSLVVGRGSPRKPTVPKQVLVFMRGVTRRMNVMAFDMVGYDARELAFNQSSR